MPDSQCNLQLSSQASYFDGPLHDGKMVKLPQLPSGVSSELHVISKQSIGSPTEEPFGFSAMNFSVSL